MLHGRDAERALIGALLDDARASASGACVVRGVTGSGKTALLDDARDRADGMHVLRVRGVPAESELPFAGLHQLLRPALRLLERLPAPQSRALEGALGLVEQAGENRFLIGAACLTLLAELAEESPVLCLVDDAQWLDAPSADALLFVARRLDAEGIAMLLAARDGDGPRFEAPALRELELGALAPAAAAALLAGRAGGPVAPAIGALLVERARGNPLALVELPAALSPAQLAGAEPLPDTLPLADDVEALFLERVLELPAATRRLLLVVAADEGGKLAPVLRAAATLGVGADALAAAERARLVSVRGRRVEMRHPLVGSAVYQAASSAERRAVHLALADALDADQRAWHRAAAALEPDAAVADALERTAERAQQRSGHAAAAAALDRAAELSVDAASRARRLVAAAHAAWHAGQAERATVLLDRAAPLVAGPALDAELHHLRGVIAWRTGALLEACTTLLDGAELVAPLDGSKALELLFDAGLAAWDAGDDVHVAAAGARAAELPSGGDEERAFRAELLVGVADLSQGRPPPAEGLLARAGERDEPRILIWAAIGAAAAGEDALEAALLRRAAALARASGAVDMLTLALEGAAVQGLLAGRTAAAEEATEGLALARDARLHNAADLHLAALAWLSAVRGDEAACRADAAAVVARARPAGAALANALAEWSLGLLDLGAGRPEEAAARLQALHTAPRGAGHPFIALASTPDLVEACVRTGRDEDARAAYTRLEAVARPGATRWILALAARSRGLLAPDGQAETELAAALELLAGARPFDRARTELLLGERLRRRRMRVDARTHLRAALDTFDALGAAPWAEQARAGLRASGETARKRDPSTLAQLTPQELQVARFVGEGLSNKEVAAQLFLSPRTIDAHLRSVFAKLGVTSRTQLARQLPA